MIDITPKPVSLREAVAGALVRISPSTLDLIREGKTPKGDPLEVARVAAIQAVKNTSQIIPYCHPLPVTHVAVEFWLGEGSIEVTVGVKAIYSTGVEMEAMTGAAVAALTLYDMLKAVDDAMEISWVRLLEKRGGKSQYPRAFSQGARAAVVVVSDSAFRGIREDESGKTIEAFLKERGARVEEMVVVPDEVDDIRRAVGGLLDRDLDLIVVTGGTGLGPRDVTPEALEPLIDKRLPGVAEAVRAYGQMRTPFACLSRTLAGLAGSTIIMALPGSPRAVVEGLTAVFPALVHAMAMVRGEGH